jgi:hypothetical protein
LDVQLFFADQSDAKCAADLQTGESVVSLVNGGPGRSPVAERDPET